MGSRGPDGHNHRQGSRLRTSRLIKSRARTAWTINPIKAGHKGGGGGGGGGDCRLYCKGSRGSIMKAQASRGGFGVEGGETVRRGPHRSHSPVISEPCLGSPLDSKRVPPAGSERLGASGLGSGVAWNCKPKRSGGKSRLLSLRSAPALLRPPSRGAIPAAWIDRRGALYVWRGSDPEGEGGVVAGLWYKKQQNKRYIYILS